MQPKPGTSPAAEEAANTDDRTKRRRATDSMRHDRGQRPQHACLRSSARAASAFATRLTMECFGDWVDDMRLCPTKSDEPRIWPRLLGAAVIPRAGERLRRTA